jgi:dihydrofolate reductase
MYETMLYWETAHTLPDQSPAAREFVKIWHGAQKIVYSRTLSEVSSAKTRIERDFDPQTVRHLKATAARDLTVGGSELAARAIEFGLVDELHLFVTPITLGGGKPALSSALHQRLELLDLGRFHSGVVRLRYGFTT